MICCPVSKVLHEARIFVSLVIEYDLLLVLLLVGVLGRKLVMMVLVIGLGFVCLGALRVYVQRNVLLGEVCGLA